jgi:hypothetical protein
LINYYSMTPHDWLLPHDVNTVSLHGTMAPIDLDIPNAVIISLGINSKL